MPHSSGGGSSHGGSHGSSRSRSKPADMRFGRRYYPGAKRFRYFRNGTEEYYYSERPYTLKDAKKAKTKSFFSGLLSAIMGIFFAFAGLLGIPHKVKTNYDTEILIRDTAQVLSTAEEMEMSDAFSAFLDKTGVMPAFYTINPAEKQGKSLESYAYDLYVNTFDDEKHWLVVYCGNAGSWEWEGMIGDDCGSMIKEDLENELTKRLQRNLENDPQHVAAGVIDAFNTVRANAGKFSFKGLDGYALTLLFGALCLYAAVKKFSGALKTDPAADPRINSELWPETKSTPEPEPKPADEPQPAPESASHPQIIKCDHCGAEFNPGDRTDCPYCGASLESWE